MIDKPLNLFGRQKVAAGRPMPKKLDAGGGQRAFDQEALITEESQEIAKDREVNVTRPTRATVLKNGLQICCHVGSPDPIQGKVADVRKPARKNQFLLSDRGEFLGGVKQRRAWRRRFPVRSSPDFVLLCQGVDGDRYTRQ